ncbi:hypothetical protein TIFTF001_028559 [Ficus carica]|uniref:Uncharacterized protein n=1 Tax=Ficus carica TaxID=3494 RepID=A0AA88DQM2_FICCA|nr:hypothetical protein TIFTF001_028559 [Ficus carica]
MTLATTPNVVGVSRLKLVITPQAITCKMGAPRNDGDTGVVFVMDTLMLKSARKLMSKRRGRALTRQKMTIPEFGGSSSIYRRFSWVRVLGTTRPGQLPRIPGGPSTVSGRVPWVSPMKGQQCPSEWLAAGGDLTDDRSRIWSGSRSRRKACPVLGPQSTRLDREGFKIYSAKGASRTRQAEKATRKSDQLGKFADTWRSPRVDAPDSPRVGKTRVEPSARHAADGGKTSRRPNSNFELKGVIGRKLNRRMGIYVRSDHWAPINRRGGASFAIICKEDYLPRAAESY